MINELTSEQKLRKKEIKDFWVNTALFSGDEINKKDATEGILNIYSGFTKKQPKVMFMSSPYGAQILANFLDKKIGKEVGKEVGDEVRNEVENEVWKEVGGEVRNEVWDEVWNEVRDEVWNEVRNEVWDEVWKEVGGEVRNEVWDEVWNEVRDEVWNEVRDEVWKEVGGEVKNEVREEVWDEVKNERKTFYNFGWYDLSNIGWVSFYDFFLPLGIYSQKRKEKFEKYKKFILSGVFFSLYFDNLVIFSRRPCICKKDDRGRLHSISSPAIAWRDGYSLYFIEGVAFPKEWWEKIVNDTLTPDEVFAIDNLEHRRIAYQYMDKAKMKSLKDYKVLDEIIDEKGNPAKILSFTVQNMEEPIRLYNCICPTTGREYHLQTNKNTCKEAKEGFIGIEDVEFVNEW